MALTAIEQHYAKHKEDLRLTRRHGIVEFNTTMAILHRYLRQLEQGNSHSDNPQQGEAGGNAHSLSILDVGCGTGRYAIALQAEGYNVDCVELVRHNIDVMLANAPHMRVRQGDARSMPWIADASRDVVLLLGPLYHLIGDEAKLAAMREAKRVVKPGGVILIAYLMNEYSILSYCFDEERMPALLERGFVTPDFHVNAPEGELYDYVRLDDINRLNALARLRRLTVFSPEGPADFMRTRLNRMSDASFRLFLDYQLTLCERPDLLGAGSHLVDVVTPLNLFAETMQLF